MLVWIGALIVGTILGLLQIGVIDETANFVATVYVRLFQLLAVPTIVLAITTTLATLGSGPDAGRIFRHTISYTLLTTLVAAAVGLLLYVIIAYVIIAPGNMQLPVADSELPIAGSQLSAQLSAGVIADSLGKYVAVVLGGNLLQSWESYCPSIPSSTW